MGKGMGKKGGKGMMGNPMYGGGMGGMGPELRFEAGSHGYEAAWAAAPGQ